jgi:hypothetical protein
MKFITRCVMIAVAIAPFAVATPVAPLPARDRGYAYGSDIGSMTNCAGDDEALGSRLQALASKTAEENIRDGDLTASDREQWIKGFIAGYAKGYKDPDCD